MGAINLSSSPLSTLYPSYSPQVDPDYSNIFKIDFNNLNLASFKPQLTNYAQKYASDMLPSMNRAKFNTGLTLSTSSNALTAMTGKQMMGTTSPNTGTSIDWSKGFDLLSSIDQSSKAGKITAGLGKVGSSAVNLSKMSKAAGGFKNLTGAQKAGGVGAIIGTTSDLIGGFMPEKDEYSGEKGHITQTLDTVYDSISDAAMSMGPWGMLVGGIMKGGAMLGKGLNALGGGTDGKTTTDAILGSSFFNLTPFGLINGFGGKKTDTITKNNEVFSQVGTSYTGTESTVDQAIAKQGKYGAFSSGARKRANRLIAEAKRQQGIIEDIADLAQDRFAIRDSMAAINGNRLRFQLQGGYNQANVRVGKLGMSLNKARETLNRINYKRESTEILSQDVQKMKEGGQIKAVSTEIFLIIPEFQKGGTIEDPFEHYISTLPLAQRDSTNYRVRDYWEYNGRPKDFEEAKKKGMFSFNQKDNSYHARSIAENPQTGDIEFMKSSNHPTIFMETDWYEKGLIHNDDGTTLQLEPGIEGYEDWQDFKNNYELQKTDPYWKYVRRKDTPSHKEGGQIQVKPTEIILAEPIESGIDAFKEGGSINVIPEGALHARKHNMDMEGITKKGIPVVSDKENGEIEQQAEIEREEIILRLEVTQKLEELEKKFYNDETSQKEKDELALEAGKLLVEEIIYNTQDNTNKLL